MLPIGLALLAMTSCSSDVEEQQAYQPTPITLISSVDQTRTANVNLQKTQIASGVETGVFVRTSSGYISGGDNAKMTADGNGTFTGSVLHFPSDGSAVSVYAYAPYSTAFASKDTEAVTFSVAADQSTDAGYLKSDLLCGAPTGTNSFTENQPTVPLNFVHKLSKLTVKFRTSAETDVDLNGATINIVNTLPTTTLKVADGTVGQASGSATSIKAVTFGSDATAFTASAVVVPQTVSAGSFVQVLLTNGKMLDAKLNSAATFASGKAYTYAVNISGQGAEASAEIALSSTVTDWDSNTSELTGDVEETEAPEVRLYASFGTPGGNASYSATTYTWTAGNNNLMTVFEFSGGELANYKTLKFTISNLSEGASVRMGYYIGSEWTEFGNGYYSAGEKTVDLTALGIDLSKVTKISFGGKSGSGGSVDIVAGEVYLVEGGGGTSGGGSGSSDGSTLTATFGTPGGNASYNAPTYTWTAGNNNLMTVFEFSGGELANYKTLTFTFSNLVDGPVRMGYYVGSTFTEFGNGYYNAGTKTVDLTALGIDLSTVTKISFGGRSNAGSCDILAKDVILSK